MTRLVLSHPGSDLIVANSPNDEYLGLLLRKNEPRLAMKEHPGAFYVSANDRSVLIAGDGRVLDGSERNLWHEFMSGCNDGFNRRFIAKATRRGGPVRRVVVFTHAEVPSPNPENECVPVVGAAFCYEFVYLLHMVFSGLAFVSTGFTCQFRWVWLVQKPKP